MPTLLLRGEGIAGSCCAQLLRGARMDITVETAPRPKLPAIMMGETTQKLLSDVFERSDLFTGFTEIRRRIVAWGREAEVLNLPHSAVVASEQELLDRIYQGLEKYPEAKSGHADWTIFASSPLPPLSVEHQFGARPAAASAVTLDKRSDTDACWIESAENGWLFLLPVGDGLGWLLSVGDSVESLLAGSRLIKRQIAGASPPRGTFLSHPRIAFPLSAPGWLACGTAALAFDPLCGDGAGNAVREAILASALIRAVSAGGDPQSLAAHYQARLLGGFHRHIALCFDFYKAGHSSPWWDRQVEDLKRGLVWCSEQLAGMDPSRYRLNGFELEPVR
jgi:hypothetical protein